MSLNSHPVRRTVVVAGPSEAAAAIAAAGAVVVGIEDAASHEPEVLLARPGPWPTPLPSWTGGLRWVHLAAGGPEAYPPGLLRARLVTSSRSLHAPQVAERVLYALLSDLNQGLWVDGPWAPGDHRPAPRRLAGSTVGLVGLGLVGTAVARRLLPLGVRVRGIRRRPAAPIPGAQLVNGVELARDVTELLATSDAVVLAAPATAATGKMIGASVLGFAKPGLHLINVGAGGVLDHDAVREALDEGGVRLVTLDVTDPAPPPAGHWLYEHPRVRLSPAAAGTSTHVEAGVITHFLDNLDRWRNGRPLLDQVEPVEPVAVESVRRVDAPVRR
ncbi:NAD(P)-dependent oxidoreductase [Actinomadura sp. SCN-SB]|uniref:NAD(P)-dependent oxidoreductase n=1 Tax=Actinomadura sp. SCN-SB TaxID=3373092 RepID=UPI00374FFD8B